MTFVIGIALVVDELHKGQRLVYRYPESIPSNVLNAQDQLLKFHRDYLSLSPDNFAKLFRPKAALFNKVLELTIDDLHYVSFPCPCSDELSSDSSVSTSTDVITLFNVVIATVRESTMKALLAKTKPSHGNTIRRDGGTAIKVGVDPVAVALGLGGNSFQGVPQPKLLRRVVETVSRALLHQEKRNRYVSKQVTQMLRLQEYNNGITTNTVKTVNNSVQTITNSSNPTINTTTITTTGATTAVTAAATTTTSTKTNTTIVSSSPQSGSGGGATGIASTGGANVNTSGKSGVTDISSITKRRMTVTGASLFMGASTDKPSTTGSTTTTMMEAVSLAVANVSPHSSSSSSSSSGVGPTNASLLISAGFDRGNQDPVVNNPTSALVPVSASVVRAPSPTLSFSSLHSNMSVMAVGGGIGNNSTAPIPIPVSTDNNTNNVTSIINTSSASTAATQSPTTTLPSLLPLSTIANTVTAMITTDTNVGSLQAPSSSSSTSTNNVLLPDKNLQIMEMMQQQCSLANELRQIYHGLVGGHSVNVMVNGTLSISIRLQNDDGDHLSVNPIVSPSAPTISGAHIPSTVSPTTSPRISPYIAHNAPFTASAWSRESSAVIEENSSYIGGQSAAQRSSSYGYMTFLTIAEREAMLPLISSISCTSQPASLAPLSASYASMASSSSSKSSARSTSSSLPSKPFLDASTVTTSPSLHAPSTMRNSIHLHPQMEELVLSYDPTLSLEDLCMDLEQPLSDVYVMCCHLRDWGLGRFVLPISAERRYRVHRDAPSDPHSKASRTFAAAFGESLHMASVYLMKEKERHLGVSHDKTSHTAAGRMSTKPSISQNTSRENLIQDHRTSFSNPQRNTSSSSLKNMQHGGKVGNTDINRTTHTATSSSASSSSSSEQKSSDKSSNISKSSPSTQSNQQSSTMEYSLPCVLSIFDGHRMLDHAVTKLPPPLQPFAVDMVIWLLRWNMLEEVYTYLITYGSSLGELAQATVSIGQNHHTTSTMSTHGNNHDKQSHPRKGGKNKPTSAASLSRSYSNNAMTTDPDERTTTIGNDNVRMDGHHVTMALSDHDWEICSRIWPYFTSPSSSTSNNTSTKSNPSTNKTSNEYGEPMNKPFPGDTIPIQGTTCIPLHEIVWREGLIEEDVMKMIRKLPQFFAVYYC